MTPPPHEETSRVARPLSRLLVGAYAYPFDRVTVVWIGAVFVAATLASFAPLGGILAAAIEVAFFVLVLRSTAAGKEALEVDVSEVGGAWSWFAPLLRYLVAAVVSFAPGIVAALAFDPDRDVLLVAATSVVCAAYSPASLVVAAQGSFAAVLNPVNAASLVFRIPGPYFVTVFFLALTVSGGGALHRTAAEIETPFVGLFLGRVIELYTATVVMRMLGLLVYEHREELG